MEDATKLPAATEVGDATTAKLRRFLGTLAQFGSDISPEVGDRVRDLVVRLLDSSATIEEFHSELNSATNYPLRPFVIPFLRASLPLMQCELVHRSRLAGKTTAQFLADTELAEVLQLAPAAAAGEELPAGRTEPKRRPSLGSDEPHQPDRGGKRRKSMLIASDNSADDASPTREVAMTTHHATAQSPTSVTSARQSVSDERHPAPRQHVRAQRRRRRLHRPQAEQPPDSVAATPAGSGNDEDGEPEPSGGGSGEAAAGTGDTPPGQPESISDGGPPAAAKDEWQRLESMLSAVVDMVSRARRSLTSLQRAGGPAVPQAQTLAVARSTGTGPGQSPATAFAQLQVVSEWVPRRRHDRPENDGDASKARQQNLHQQQQQQQQLDTLVSAIRRQAQQEIRLAVAAAEARAAELVAAEKLRTERLLALAREEALASARVQTNSAESCWNCGRAASETCSGCSTARYCGSFCQHKDWDRHQKACRPQLQMMQDSLVDSSRMLSTAKTERRYREGTD